MALSAYHRKFIPHFKRNRFGCYTFSMTHFTLKFINDHAEFLKQPHILSSRRLQFVKKSFTFGSIWIIAHRSSYVGNHIVDDQLWRPAVLCPFFVTITNQMAISSRLFYLLHFLCRKLSGTQWVLSMDSTHWVLAMHCNQIHFSFKKSYILEFENVF